MPRRPTGPRYFASRNAYYCQWQGNQHLLAKGPDDFPDGPVYKAALKAFGELMASGNIEKAGDSNQIQDILETYMQHAQNKLRSSTLAARMNVLKPFQQTFGALPVGELTHYKVEQFILQMRQPRKVIKSNGVALTCKWADTTIAFFLEALNAALNWAKKRKPPLISANPLEGFVGPKARSRSRDLLLGPGAYLRILTRCRKSSLRNLIIALEATGARPGELANAKTTDWNDELGAIVYYADDRRREDEFQHKNAKYKDRFIYFTGEALEMVRQLVRTRPTGSYLFTSSMGRPLTINCIVKYFSRLRNRLGMPRLSSYSFRHTLATNWLVAGKSIEILSELLGNSPQTIRKHYAHLCGHRHAIRGHLEEFRLAQKTCMSNPSPGGLDVSVSPAPTA